MIKETDLAWAAGFFDGEGHIRRPHKKYNTRQIQVAQKTIGCLERLQQIFKTGNIKGPYHRKNPCYFWLVTTTSEVDRVMNLMWPYLYDVKKRQALDAGFEVGKCYSPKRGRPCAAQKTKPKCHPSGRHIGNGLCEKCYFRERMRRVNNVSPSKWRIPESYESKEN